MREAEFRRYLENCPGIESQDAISTRISKGNSVENYYDISLDHIVSNDLVMYSYLEKINADFNNKNGGYSNALRKYYTFCTGSDFPKLNEFRYCLSVAADCLCTR